MHTVYPVMLFVYSSEIFDLAFDLPLSWVSGQAGCVRHSPPGRNPSSHSDVQPGPITKSGVNMVSRPPDHPLDRPEPSAPGGVGWVGGVPNGGYLRRAIHILKLKNI